MGYFAKLNQRREVTNVVVADEEYIDGLTGIWVETYPNDPIRKNFAGVGFTYDYGKDAFIAPKPYPSWVLNETTCQWEAPIPVPNQPYVGWDEEKQEWILIP